MPTDDKMFSLTAATIITLMHEMIRICSSMLIIHTDDPETRDMWWKEVRTEVRSHARALGCHSVLAYQENTSIWCVVFFLLHTSCYWLPVSIVTTCAYCQPLVRQCQLIGRVC